MAQRELVNKEVSKVFEAIFNRMSIADIEKMLVDRKAAQYASMNNGNSTQLAVGRVGTMGIEKAVSNIIDHDMSTILKVLAESDLLIRLSNKVLDEKN
jgi:hypothetical protein